MRQAIHQISSRYPTIEEAEDGLRGVLGLKEVLGIVGSWICEENRVHIIVTKIADIDKLSRPDIQPGQRLINILDEDAVA